MITRVTQATINHGLQASISRLQRDLAIAQELVSTQKRLREPSDDPAGTARVTRLRAEGRALTAFSDGIGFGVGVLGAEDAALGQADDVLTRAREIAAQQATGLSTATSRQQAAEEVAELERALLALGNTTIAGRHVFGGLATGAAPFASLDDPLFDPTAPYSGPTAAFAIQTGPDGTIRLTTPGDQVLGAAIVAIDDLRTTLASGAAPSASIDAIETAAATVRQERASVGARLARLQDRTQEIDALLDGTRKALGVIEDADMTTTISELVQLQHALEATLAASRTLQTSILDFLQL